MTDDEKQDTQKTVVAFIAGLLIGGLLVWVFGGDSQVETQMTDDDQETAEVADDSSNDSSDNEDTSNDSDASAPETPVLPTGEGEVSVPDQAAGSVVVLDGATFPTDEGWVGVRDYTNGQISGLLGVARFSKEQGLVPAEVELLRATEAGNEYAVVFYSESGDREFNLAEDMQLEGMVETFTAN